MKKTLVALAVTAFAASASAVTVYNNDGTKIDLNGRVNLQVKNSESDGQRTDLKNNGSRLTFTVNQTITESLSALAQAEIRFDQDKTDDVNFSNPNGTRLYAGLKANGVGTLTFGRQLSNGDGLDFADKTNAFGGINQVAGSGAKVVKFTSDSFGGFVFGADYYIGNSVRENDIKSLNTEGAFNNNYKSAYDVTVRYNGKFNEDLSFKAGVGYSSANYAVTGEKSAQRRAFSVTTGLDYQKLGFGLTYSQADDSSKKDRLPLFFDKGRGVASFNITKARALSAGVSYKVLDNLNVYTTYIYGKGTQADKDSAKSNTFIVGTGYDLHKNVRTYIEAAKSRTKHNDGSKASDTKFAVGFGVFF